MALVSITVIASAVIDSYYFRSLWMDCKLNKLILDRIKRGNQIDKINVLDTSIRDLCRVLQDYQRRTDLVNVRTVICLQIPAIF
jgi:hypothetical protein